VGKPDLLRSRAVFIVNAPAAFHIRSGGNEAASVLLAHRQERSSGGFHESSTSASKLLALALPRPVRPLRRR
jgi:hypothetical protein